LTDIEGDDLQLESSLPAVERRRSTQEGAREGEQVAPRKRTMLFREGKREFDGRIARALGTQ